MALLASDPHTGAVSTQRNRLATIAGQVPKPSDWPGGCRFVERCRFATEACTVAVPLASRTTGEGEVRCIRATELAATHVRWEDAQPRVTSTVRIQLGARNE
jgi:peptide/nickel transport system permease protein